MDRRMYRGNMGYGNRNVSPYRPNDPVCSDVAGDYYRDKDCGKDDCDDTEFDRDSKCFPLGMCYVPWQQFKNLYDNEFAALAHGTLFKDLDYDFYGRSCK